MIVDGHEDIAYNVLMSERDFTLSVAETRAREDALTTQLQGSCTVGLPDLLASGVGIVFATLFSLPASAQNTDLPKERGYTNADEAHVMALAQLEVYRSLARRADVRLITSYAELQQFRTDYANGAECVGLVILMENGDPIRTPAETAWWQAQGVRIVGPAWQATRYCGGTRHPGPLTNLGRDLLRELEAARLILDISHMAEESFWQALDHFHGPVIASHSNCRAFVSAPVADRHLSDEMLRALIERDAVIGAVLLNGFIVPNYQRGQAKALVGLEHLIRHIDHICQLAGNTRHVAIGSDLDGGFGSENLPYELDSVADLPRIGTALDHAGYSQADIAAIMGGNWLRILEENLP